ncbi:flocculation protein FLO11-like [Cucumis melo var. makuwa]|uniref:Flocculation protein FLO11-like n=1 Tax=Cucumis melo var. makuwa TaxID=1194695 RepID=A0A5D3BNR5_CUCMM|nr:flocculation protein FLO11-like [Cucumis melo var. makuwa]TYK00765.1 flocculation protein FLO11-like [Cucumis melo var. makuwa]
MVLDYDSLDNEDNVVLSTLLQRKPGHPTKSSSTPSKPTLLKPTQVTCSSPRGASPSMAVPSQTPAYDYVSANEETPVPEETTMSTKDCVSSLENHTSKPQSTEGPSDSSISMSPPRHVGSSSRPRHSPVRGQRVISTKVGRRKIPLNVPHMPIDGVSFHSEEGAHKWKYVVRCRIADEANIFDQYRSCPIILDLIRNAGLLRSVSEVGPFYPRLIHELIVNLPSVFSDLSAEEFHKVHIRGVCFHISPDYAMSYLTPECLAAELIRGIVPVWPVDGQLPVASLTVKYAILHRIGISNWIPSNHSSTISTSMGHFVYLFGTGVKWLNLAPSLVRSVTCLIEIRRAALDVVLHDLRRVGSRSSAPPPDSQN